MADRFQNIVFLLQRKHKLRIIYACCPRERGINTTLSRRHSSFKSNVLI
uniref:Uncharacterized protein n=1 Tax=Anguilla anguilla TaxID=7936 RepID=A0A0E9RW31_ANGAN